MRFPGLIVAVLVVYVVLGALAKPAAAVWSAAVSAVHWISIVLLWGGVAVAGVAAVVVIVRVGRSVHAAVAKNTSPRSPRQMPTALAAAADPGTPATPPVLLPDRTNGPSPSQQVARLVVVPAPTLPDHAALHVSSAQGWSPPDLAPPTADEQPSGLPPLISPATPDIAPADAEPTFVLPPLITPATPAVPTAHTQPTFVLPPLISPATPAVPPADTEPTFALPGFADQGHGIDGAAVAQGPWLVIVGCEGVQLGECNRQINVYTYRLEEPVVDFTEILQREDVRKALREVIEHPQDKRLLKRAVRVMCAGPWQLQRHDVIDTGPQERAEVAHEAEAALRDVEGSVIIRNCDRVQIGNHNTQYNEPTLVFHAASVNTVELLDKAPRVARALVDVVTTSAHPEKGLEKLHSELTEALNSQPCHPEPFAQRVDPTEQTVIESMPTVSVFTHVQPRIDTTGTIDVQIDTSGIGDEARLLTADLRDEVAHTPDRSPQSCTDDLTPDISIPGFHL